MAGVSDDLVATGLSARALAQQAAKVVGGGGGGRDDLAQAGGSDPGKIDEALETVRRIVQEHTSTK